jgi:hypothetical protein
MASYGVAIIIITIAVSAVYAISTSNKSVFAQQCTGSSGFACGPFFINSSGVLNITLVQATGGDINIYGLACSSAINSSSENYTPNFGNIYVTNSIDYYPPGASPDTGVRIYTGSSEEFSMYCYSAYGTATMKSAGGGDFVGYIWANYSLPGEKARTTQLIATIDAKYV